MKTIILCALMLCAAPLSGQALPDAPKPHLDRLEWSLLATDAAVRGLDVYSTHWAMQAGNKERVLPSFIAILDRPEVGRPPSPQAGLPGDDGRRGHHRPERDSQPLSARLCGAERVPLDRLPGSRLRRHLQVIAALRYAEKSQGAHLEAGRGKEERGVRVGF